MKNSIVELRKECEKKEIKMAVIGFDCHGNAHIRLEKNEVVAWFSERDDKDFAGGVFSKSREGEYYNEYFEYCSKCLRYSSCFMSGIGWWIYEKKHIGNHDHNIAEILTYFEKA